MVGLDEAIYRDRVEFANQISPERKKESEPKSGPSRTANGTGRSDGGICHAGGDNTHSEGALQDSGLLARAVSGSAGTAAARREGQ